MSNLCGLADLDYNRPMEPEFLPFTVEVWNAEETAIERTVARCTNISIARGAFEQAVRVFPGKTILLCNRAQIVRRHSG